MGNAKETKKADPRANHPVRIGSVTMSHQKRDPNDASGLGIMPNGGGVVRKREETVAADGGPINRPSADPRSAKLVRPQARRRKMEADERSRPISLERNASKMPSKLAVANETIMSDDEDKNHSDAEDSEYST